MFCGIDIIEVSRIKEAIESNKNFTHEVFTDNEIQNIDKSNVMKYQRYAGRFAAKEAVYKAISKILIKKNININFKDIEIENIEEEKGRPKVKLLIDNDILEEYNIDISISHVKENAVAMCTVSLK